MIQAVPILTCILTAGSALAGVFVTSLLKRRDDRALWQYEDRQEFRRFVRERSETAFATLHNTRLAAHRVILADLALLEGKNDPGIYKAFTPIFPAGLRQEIDDIRFSLEAYLPGALESFYRWSSEANMALVTRRAVIERALAGASEASDLDVYRHRADAFMECINELCSVVVQLCRETNCPPKVTN
ncbi:hypothetical protein [Sphingomonas sp.]|uniref:hypothetical protein n=1 Tax=Sphingomonas sp. TaxID=28214 RepID=UPI002DD62850|nr:hypothetical protein [Sphingomonas sp.]